MDIKFENGSEIKTIENNDNIRRKRATQFYPLDMKELEELLGYKLKWHQKLWIDIQCVWIKLKIRINKKIQ